MAIQNTTARAPKSQRPALLAFVPILLCGDPLSKAAVHLNHLVCALTCALLKFAPSIIWAGCHIVGSYILAHQHLFLCVQTLLSFSPLLHFICAAA